MVASAKSTFCIKEECGHCSYINEDRGEEGMISVRNTFVPVESEERKIVGQILEA